MKRNHSLTPRKASLPNTFNKRNWYRENIGVYLFGPYSHIDPVEGTESPYWVLTIQRKQEDLDENPKKSYRSGDYRYLYSLGEKIASDRKIDFESFACNA